MMHPWLSIIIPIYNAEAYIKKCVRSILNQSYKNFELIFVDDGSTDASSEICLEYSKLDDRITYLKKGNGGPFQARLFGIEHAHGEYITFCDADDYYSDKNAFAKIYQAADKNPDAIQFGHRVKYNHLYHSVRMVKQPLYIERDAFLRDEYPLFLCSFYDHAHVTLNVWNKVYRCSLLKTLPSSKQAERLFWGDDLVLNLLALKNCRSMMFVPNSLYIYRETTGGTTCFSETAMKDLDTIKRYQLSYLEEVNPTIKEVLLRTIYSETACWLGDWVRDGLRSIGESAMEPLIRSALEMGQIKKAREYYLNENDLDWIAMELLRQASVEKYIEWAKESPKEKLGLKGWMKKIYKLI